MPSPQVSVVLPCYNRGSTLAAAARSVLNQSYTNLELIVVDGSSDDHTPEVLEDLAADPRVRVITHAPRGCAKQRNQGVQAANGAYMAFQDSDDEWLPGRLEQTMALLEQQPSTPGLSYSDMIFQKLDGSEGYLAAPEVIQGLLINPKSLDYQVFGLGIQTSVMHRDCIEQAGPFDESLSRFIDLDFLIRASALFPFYRIPRALVRHFEGHGISSNAPALAHARKTLLKKYEPQLRQHRLHWAMQHLLTAQALSASFDLAGALDYAEKAKQLGRWRPRFRHQAHSFVQLVRKALATSPMPHTG